MAVAPEDLLQPAGPIDPSFFPEDTEPPATGAGTLLNRLSAYINRATVRATDHAVPTAHMDAAVTNWALHLAFEDAHALMAARPASENYLGGLGGHAYNTEQLKVFARKALEYKLGYETILSAVPGAPPTSPMSRTTRINFDW